MLEHVAELKESATRDSTAAAHGHRDFVLVDVQQFSVRGDALRRFRDTYVLLLTTSGLWTLHRHTHDGGQRQVFDVSRGSSHILAAEVEDDSDAVMNAVVS